MKTLTDSGLKIIQVQSHNCNKSFTSSCLFYLTHTRTHTCSALSPVTLMSPCPLAFHPSKSKSSVAIETEPGCWHVAVTSARPAVGSANRQWTSRRYQKAKLLFLGQAVALLGRVQTYTFHTHSNTVCVSADGYVSVRKYNFRRRERICPVPCQDGVISEPVKFDKHLGLFVYLCIGTNRVLLPTTVGFTQRRI